jgi:hypothetical protein
MNKKGEKKKKEEKRVPARFERPTSETKTRAQTLETIEA